LCQEPITLEKLQGRLFSGTKPPCCTDCSYEYLRLKCSPAFRV
jgi:hypothetical protein